jgi:hypothetical protein
LKEGEYKLLLHTRSDKVMTDRGKITVVPQFGFEPIPDGEAFGAFAESFYEHNKFIVYNIFREFCEELYGMEELVDSPKLGTTLVGFVERPEVQELKKYFEDGIIKIIFLGHGFEAAFGAKILCFLLVVDNIEAAKSIYKKRKTNWEINDLEEIELTDEGIKKLDAYQQENKLTPYASFTISRALEWLRGNP